jgi:3-phenylpropionate/trans-cinnamate dioxygenase ferredoxin reductase subunit
MPEPAVVIVGAGTAGFQVAAGLRDLRYEGRVILVGDEDCGPYHRPPLSKTYLLGTTDDARVAMRPEVFYNDRKIELRTGQRAVAIDRTHRKLALDDDTVIPYTHLVLAVGARNRPLPVSGAELNGVFFLRTLDEARALRARLARARNAVVIGAGFIGLEFASAARKSGVAVTVIDVADRPMARALSAEMSNVFTREHAKAGVRFLFNTQVMRLMGAAGHVTGVETVEGEVLDADLVVIGIGVIPNVELAATCDLDIRNGIVVDEQLLTGDPNISAVGDCAAHPNPFAPGMTRIESVQNATDQGRCVAARIAGRPSAFCAVPWFWSDQGDLKLQIAGIATGCERVIVRGDPASASCAAFCFSGERLLAVETVSRPADHMAARHLIAHRAMLTPEQAADESFDLKKLAADSKAAGAAGQSKH